MDDETEQTTTTTASRAKSTIDVAAKTLTMIGADGSEMVRSLEGYPPNVAIYLMGRGLALRLSGAKDAAAADADLKAGKLPIEKVGGVKEPSLNEQAIALAMRDHLAKDRDIKKSDKPAFADLLTETRAMVAKMDKTKKAAMRAHADVISYIGALKRQAGPQLSLMELAG